MTVVRRRRRRRRRRRVFLTKKGYLKASELPEGRMAAQLVTVASDEEDEDEILGSQYRAKNLDGPSSVNGDEHDQ